MKVFKNTFYGVTHWYAATAILCVRRCSVVDAPAHRSLVCHLSRLELELLDSGEGEKGELHATLQFLESVKRTHFGRYVSLVFLFQKDGKDFRHTLMHTCYHNTMIELTYLPCNTPL